jgi:molybdopterin-guanine dinucleotide biosynthesis protein A
MHKGTDHMTINKITTNNSTNMKKLTSIILAGGQSRRMGHSKALLAMEKGTVIEQLVELLQPQSQKIVIVTNDDDESFIRELVAGQDKLSFTKDQPPFVGEGPLAGIYSALLLESQGGLYFVCACDVVNIDMDYIVGLEQLALMKPNYEAFIPVSNGRVQPLVGVYRFQQATLERILYQKKRRLVDLLQELSVYYIEEKEWKKWTKVKDPFFNMNTPNDYKTMLEKRRDSSNESD